MKKRDLLIPVVMLAVGAGVGFLLRDQQGAPDATTELASAQTGATGDTASADGATTTTATAATGDEAQTAQAVKTSAASAAALSAAGGPLPPLDAPLSGIYDTLLERAQRGDGRAACRLAAELQQCADRDFMLEGADRAARMLEDEASRGERAGGERPDWESRRREFAQLQIDAALALDERCAGVTQAQLDSHVDLWRRAAQTGHVPSMVHYAQGDGFRMRATLENLERLQVYKSEAERMMRAAAAAGSVEAAQQLSMAYGGARGPWSGLFQQAVEPDPVEAHALEQLAQQRGYTATPAMQRGPGRRGRQGGPEGLQQTPTTSEQRASGEQLAAKYNVDWQPAVRDSDGDDSPWNRDRRSREACDRDQFTTLR